MALAVASRIVASVVRKAEKSISYHRQYEFENLHHIVLTGMVRLSAPTAVVTVGVLMISELSPGKTLVKND